MFGFLYCHAIPPNSNNRKNKYDVIEYNYCNIFLYFQEVVTAMIIIVDNINWTIVGLHVTTKHEDDTRKSLFVCLWRMENMQSEMGLINDALWISLLVCKRM